MSMNLKALLEPVGTFAWWRSMFAIVLGCLIMAVGYSYFVSPYNIVPGGVYGMGKQRYQRGGIWYTATSGIWQTVWLESVPENLSLIHI